MTRRSGCPVCDSFEQYARAGGVVTADEGRSWTRKEQAAIERLMTAMPGDTPEKRRNHAEWIFEGIADALTADVSEPMP